MRLAPKGRDMRAVEQEQWVTLIEPVASELLGEPNRKFSTATELRFGTRGSLSVDLEKGTWFDFETNVGGGVVDLIEREVRDDPGEWLRARGYEIGEPPRKPAQASAPARKIDKVFDYRDGDGTLLFQVVRFIPKDFRQRRPDPSQPDGYTWSRSRRQASAVSLAGSAGSARARANDLHGRGREVR